MSYGGSRVAILSFLALASSGCSGTEEGPDSFRFSMLPGEVKDQALLLAIDDYSLPIKRNLSLYYSKPEVRLEPVLTPSRENPNAPDYSAAHFYGTVLHDRGKYRMWYYAAGKDNTTGPVCYAESEDGLHWVKPILGQREYRGSRQNNALELPGEKMYGGHVIKDEQDPNPQKRYKMIYNLHNGKTWVFRAATSPDGIHWNVPSRDSVDQFIEISSFYKHQGLYVVHGQANGYSEGGHPQGRQGYTALSANFDDWLPGFAEAFLIREPEDPAQRGYRKAYDQVHLGVGATSFGTVLVGLFGLWHHFTGDETRKISDAWFGHGKISADLSLVISNDGIHFREPVKGNVYISRRDSPVTPFKEKDFPTILCQSGNGILNVRNKTLIYHGRWRNAEEGGDEYYAEVALATLPRDRWGALGLFSEESLARASPEQLGQYKDTGHLDKPEGWVWSAPVILPRGDCQVVLNADYAKLMRVEVSDNSFNLLPEYSGSNSGISENHGGLDCLVHWKGKSLMPLGGKSVRFRIHLKRESGSEPRLYAVYLRAS